MNGNGSTLIDEDEAAGLIPLGVTTHAEVDEWEQRNIVVAAAWLAARRRSVSTLLSERFVRELHRRMFSNVWRWAGKYRKSGKNIGVPAHAIAARVRDLLENVATQIAAGALEPDEIALQFHHALVLIHPFPNGNGRHARLLTETLNRGLHREPFTWGRLSGRPAPEVRESYLDALKAADRGDFSLLRRFVRT